MSLPARPGEARVPMLGGHRLVDVEVGVVIRLALGGVDGLGLAIVDTLMDVPLRQNDFNPVVVASEGEATCSGVECGDGSGMTVAEA